MTSLGFENYAEALKIYLTKYREVSHPGSLSTISSCIVLFVAVEHLSLQCILYTEPDSCFKTQSARGDSQNPNRPGSGYGPAAGQPQGGPSGVASSTGMGGGVPGGVTGVAPQSGGYHGQQEAPSNSLLGAQLENPEQDPIAYGNVYPSAGGHNGTNDESY